MLVMYMAKAEVPLSPHVDFMNFQDGSIAIFHTKFNFLGAAAICMYVTLDIYI